MSAQVVALRGGEPLNDARQAFLDAVAQSYDTFVEALGEQPEGIAYVFGSVLGRYRTAWLMRGESERGTTSFLGTAAAALLCDVGKASEIG